jgi:DNA invertase Pin-like site-specific DNA recombinase
MAFIYCRISSRNQLTGTSIDSQSELCEEYCNQTTKQR